MKTDNDSGARATGARAFALRAHGRQKYGSQPCAVHLDDVARTAAELGFTSAEHQAAAFPHGVLEDTATRASDIEQRFGHTVRIAVERLTRRKGQTESDYFGRMNALAFAVKLSDRISNIRAIGVSDAKEPARLLKKYELELTHFVNPALPYGELCKKAMHALRSNTQSGLSLSVFRFRRRARSCASDRAAAELIFLTLVCPVSRRTSMRNYLAAFILIAAAGDVYAADSQPVGNASREYLLAQASGWVNAPLGSQLCRDADNKPYLSDKPCEVRYRCYDDQGKLYDSATPCPPPTRRSAEKIGQPGEKPGAGRQRRQTQSPTTPSKPDLQTPKPVASGSASGQDPPIHQLSGPYVKLRKLKCVLQNNYTYGRASGEIENISKQALHQVEVVVTWSGGGGPKRRHRPIAIKSVPLKPGDRVSFESEGKVPSTAHDCEATITVR